MADSPTTDTLIDQLVNGAPNNPDAHWQAAIALGDITDPADRERRVTALLGVLSAPTAHALTRTHAAESLARLGDPRAVAGLTAALNDPYRLVRAYALGALAQFGSGEALVTRMLALLDDPFFGVRAEAAAAAVAIAQREGDPTLRDSVRAALTRRRAVEQASTEPGAARVIAEIDRSLARLAS